MGKVLQFTKDTLTSLVSGLGLASKDKVATTYYSVPLWTDQQLIEAYRGSWLSRKIVNIPAFDAFRRWRSWQAEDQVIELIEKEEKRLGLKHKLLEAKIKARLFGGAALYISTGDPDPSQPLDLERVGKGGIRFVNVMLRRDLTAGEIERDAESEWYGRPAYYELKVATNTAAGQIGQRIHPSRLVIFRGEELPDEELSVSVDGRGWGDSVLISTLDAIKNADSTAGNIASLVFEAKVDIVRVPDLMASLADPNYEARLLQRFNLANVAKGVNSMLLLDKEEEYESKSASFQTLPDILMAFMQIVSGAADIPVTRLLGQSPAGLNSTGESDLRNYYDRIQSIQEMEITPALTYLDEALIRSATGTRDEAIHYIWSSLWQISDKERADIGKLDAETINILSGTGLFPPEALANAGANMLVEHSIMPGLLEEIENAGGLPDFEAEAEAEREQAMAQIETANQNNSRTQRIAANDARPMTLYLRRDVVNVDEITAWAKAQGFDTVQTGLHVTIIFTRTPLDWIKVGDDWSGDSDGRLTIPEGGPRLMEQFGEATVLQFASSRLSWRHEDIKRLGAEVDFPEYQPHITISWKRPTGVALREIEPYRGKIVLGPEIFEEVDEDWRNGIKER